MTADTSGADRTRTARIIRLALAHVVDDHIPDRDVQSVFDLTRADALAQRAVLKAFVQAGVRVVDDSADGNLPATTCAGEPTRESTDGPGPSTTTALTPVDLATARASASRLLLRDRRDPSPWRRLLTAQEEVGLAQLVRDDDVPLAVELPSGYRSTLASGDERTAAFDAFVLHNLRLVHSVAVGYPTGVAMDADDLSQSGMLGLLRAVEKFDATKGYKFSTYAMWWIRQSISRAIAIDGRTIRIPVHMHEKVQKVKSARTRLLSETGDVRLTGLCAATGYSPETVQQCLRLSMGLLSLDAALPDHPDRTIGEVLYAPPGSGTDPEEILDHGQLRSIIRQGLTALSQREAYVLTLRSGLDRDEPMTLEQIGLELGVTRERVRQIEDRARHRLAEILAGLGLGPLRPARARRPDAEPVEALPDASLQTSRSATQG
jgi:RNA polymerase primary sigma factor